MASWYEEAVKARHPHAQERPETPYTVGGIYAGNYLGAIYLGKTWQEAFYENRGTAA